MREVYFLLMICGSDLSLDFYQGYKDAVQMMLKNNICHFLEWRSLPEQSFKTFEIIFEVG